MAKGVRRVVTGHDVNGHAIVVSDGPPPATYVSPNGIARCELWSTETMPATIGEESDPDSRLHTLVPPAGGVAFKIVEFPPESKDGASLQTDDFIVAVSTAASGNHPGMHRTETVDYCIVLDGQVVLVLDRSETTLRTGDVVIQCGTNHAWSNRSTKPCRIAFFMVDGHFSGALARSLQDRHG
jgi:quercetin dioxygenase-like cupin family protein